MAKPKLEPCPFCPDGGKPFTDAYVHAWEIFARVGCRECGIGFDADGLTGRGRDAQADADALLPPLVEKWNRRAPAPAKQGAWEFVHYDHAACTNCGGEFSAPFEYTEEACHHWDELPPFCPNCGAEMKREKLLRKWALIERRIKKKGVSHADA